MGQYLRKSCTIMLKWKRVQFFLTCSQLPNFLFHALSEKRKGSSVWWLMKAHQTLLITPRSINIYELSIRRCTTCLPERLVSEAMQYRRTRWKLKKHRNTECREHTFVDPPVICCTENKAAKRESLLIQSGEYTEEYTRDHSESANLRQGQNLTGSFSRRGVDIWDTVVGGLCMPQT